MIKDDSIITLLEKVTRDIGIDNISIVDHWEADLCAIGVSNKEDKEQLVYISSYNCPKNKFYFELEYSSHEIYVKNVSNTGIVSYNELLKVIINHLGITSQNK